jgi:hypothetical protein
MLHNMMQAGNSSGAGVKNLITAETQRTQRAKRKKVRIGFKARIPYLFIFVLGNPGSLALRSIEKGAELRRGMGASPMSALERTRRGARAQQTRRLISSLCVLCASAVNPPSGTWIFPRKAGRLSGKMRRLFGNRKRMNL